MSGDIARFINRDANGDVHIKGGKPRQNNSTSLIGQWRFVLGGWPNFLWSCSLGISQLEDPSIPIGIASDVYFSDSSSWYSVFPFPSSFATFNYDVFASGNLAHSEIDVELRFSSGEVTSFGPFAPADMAPVPVTSANFGGKLLLTSAETARLELATGLVREYSRI